MFYAFTGDERPNVLFRTESVGFKKVFRQFRMQQIDEILKDINQRNNMLEN